MWDDGAPSTTLRNTRLMDEEIVRAGHSVGGIHVPNLGLQTTSSIQGGEDDDVDDDDDDDNDVVYRGDNDSVASGFNRNIPVPAKSPVALTVSGLKQPRHNSGRYTPCRIRDAVLNLLPKNEESQDSGSAFSSPIPANIYIDPPFREYKLEFVLSTGERASLDLDAAWLESLSGGGNLGNPFCAIKNNDGSFRWETRILINFPTGQAELFYRDDDETWDSVVEKGCAVADLILQVVPSPADSTSHFYSQPLLHSQLLSAHDRRYETSEDCEAVPWTLIGVSWAVYCVEMLLTPVRLYLKLKEYALMLFRLLSLIFRGIALMVDWARMSPTVICVAAETSILNSMRLGELILWHHFVVAPLQGLVVCITGVISYDRGSLHDDAAQIYDVRKNGHWDEALDSCKRAMHDKGGRRESCTSNGRSTAPGSRPGCSLESL